MHGTIMLVVLLLSGFQRWASYQEDRNFLGTNHAKNKPARQDPETLNTYTANLAVDGITSWPYCTHTYGPYNLPSNWTVDLGMLIYVTGIIIYNRPDYEYRLKHFVVYGFTSTVWEVMYNDINSKTYLQKVIRLDMSGTRAYSSIQIWIPARDLPPDEDKTNVLTLCEVEVYGNTVPVCEMPNLDSHVQIVSNLTHNVIIVRCEAGYSPREN